MRALHFSLQFFLGLALAGCSAPHKLISARHTSCPVRELEIRKLVSAPEREDWIAVCRERSFACSTRQKGRRLIYACRPLADADAGVDASPSDGQAARTTENATERSPGETDVAARNAASADDRDARAP
jgi:hypothetical protein